MHSKPANEVLLLSLLWFGLGSVSLSTSDAIGAEMLPENVAQACSDEAAQPQANPDSKATPSATTTHARRSSSTRVGGNTAPQTRSSRWNAYLPGMLR
ncbi:MAG: hypothetical protein IPO08_03790 [Xanthomonadales bacterium]|jgi:hypothetical protein|nr:hypothetical protein [Xanthomonadales bacterium]